jgi:hypothetical protein
LITALIFDAGAFERHLRILRRVEEVCGSQVCIAPVDSGVNALNLRGKLNGRFAYIFVVITNGAAKIAEAAFHQRNFEVLDGKPDNAMGRIDPVLASWNRCKTDLGGLRLRPSGDRLVYE